MAAEGYGRITGKPAVLNVTTGPGGINALNGVFGACTDSIPMLLISGQVKRETCMASYVLPGLFTAGRPEIGARIGHHVGVLGVGGEAGTMRIC
jgi:acetolactate synthase-1/2/3 large subunit